jgi:chromosome segregation ATPase
MFRNNILFLLLVIIFVGCGSGSSGGSDSSCENNKSNNSLLEQIEDMNNSINKLINDKTKLQNTIMELNTKLSESSIPTNQYNTLKNEYDTCNSTLLIQTDYIDSYRNQITKLQNTINNLENNTNSQECQTCPVCTKPPVNNTNILKDELKNILKTRKSYKGFVLEYVNKDYVVSYFGIGNNKFTIYNNKTNTFDLVFEYTKLSDIFEWTNSCGSINIKSLEKYKIIVDNKYKQELKVIQNNSYTKIYKMWKNNNHFFVYDVLGNDIYNTNGFDNGFIFKGF